MARVPLAVAVSGGLGVVMAAGLHLLGIADRADGALAGWLGEAVGQAGAAFPKTVPAWLRWVVTGALAFGLAAAMLTVPGNWRRLVLWTTALVLTLAWAPVLALAAHAPQVTAAVAAVLWVGVCAAFYARTHILPCEPSNPPRRGRRPPTDP
jgi:hypothetical protein